MIGCSRDDGGQAGEGCWDQWTGCFGPKGQSRETWDWALSQGTHGPTSALLVPTSLVLKTYLGSGMPACLASPSLIAVPGNRFSKA